MSIYSTEQTYSPPELPPYLKNVYSLKNIVGYPSDDELIGLHAVIRVAERAVDIAGVGDSLLLVQLYDHLFDVQMARYRRKYLMAVFPETTTYTPPSLPAHVSVQLESITSAPSDEDVIKVQAAIRSYQKFSDVPSMFDPQVNMELSQHLFDVQMARYTMRAEQSHTSRVPHEDANMSLARTTKPVARAVSEFDATTNNAGTGANANESYQSTQPARDSIIADAMERSNQLAEQTVQLAERSNQIAERSNQLLETFHRTADLSIQRAEQFDQLTNRLAEHFERFDEFAEGLTKPVERLGEALRTINKVLVGIQHAIVRSCKGNTTTALNCLINERGETPGTSLRASFILTKDGFVADTHPCFHNSGKLQVDIRA